MARTTKGKVTQSVGIGLPVSVVMIWVFQTVTGIAVPAEVATAWGAICSFIMAALTKA